MGPGGPGELPGLDGLPGELPGKPTTLALPIAKLSTPVGVQVARGVEE